MTNKIETSPIGRRNVYEGVSSGLSRFLLLYMIFDVCLVYLLEGTLPLGFSFSSQVGKIYVCSRDPGKCLFSA